MSQVNELHRTDDGSHSLFNHEISECYHSKRGALWESRELYIKGSGIHKRLNQEKEDEAAVVAVLDVGLGLGYNAHATIDAWEQSPGLQDLHLYSLERNSGLIESLLSGTGSWQSEWPEGWIRRGHNFQDDGEASYTGAVFSHPVSGRQLTWRICSGNAVHQQKFFQHASIDFIWQDPFSPEKNPELWTKDWFSLLKDHARINCVLMTYSVARVVKDALEAAGWSWKKIAAGGSKRSWLKAVRAEDE